MKKYIRKVIRLGKYSSALVIPNDIVEELRIREKQKLNVYLKGKKIVIEDWEKRK